MIAWCFGTLALQNGQFPSAWFSTVIGERVWSHEACDRGIHGSKQLFDVLDEKGVPATVKVESLCRGLILAEPYGMKNDVTRWSSWASPVARIIVRERIFPSIP